MNFDFIDAENTTKEQDNDKDVNATKDHKAAPAPIAEELEIEKVKFDIMPHEPFTNDERALGELYEIVAVELSRMELMVANLDISRSNIQHADLMKKQLADLNKNLEDTRKKLKAPFLDHGKVIDNFSKKIRTRTDKMKQVITSKMLPVLKEINEENKKLEAQKAQTNKRVEKRAIEEKKVKLVKTHIRKKWKWEVTDESKVPRAFLSINTVKVNAAVAAGKRKIAGIKIFETEGVV